MSDSSLKGKVVKGIFWTSLEQLSGQIVNFALGVVLARLLTPDDYGTVALVTIFISISMVLVNSGLGQALVQKREIDELDVNSVFWVSLTVSVVLYGILYWVAPAVAAYYRVAELRPILRILALGLPLYALNSVQNAELYKQMKFNLTFRISVLSVVTSAVVGIALACLGFGVWSLVWSSLSGTLAGVIARAFIVSWRPRLLFSVDRVRGLFAFGWKMLVGSLLGSVFSNLYGFVIGRRYSQSDLAFVNKGRNIPDLLQGNINASLVEVSFPALVQLQDDRERLQNALRRLLVVSTFALFPLMIFLSVESANVIYFLYGEKWAACIPYMRIICAMGSIGAVGAVNQQAILAVGRSDVHLKLTILRNVASVVILVSCITRGVGFWVLVNSILFGPISSFVDMICSSRIVGYSMRRQFVDLLPNLAIGIAVIVPTFLLNLAFSSHNPLILGGRLLLEAALAIGMAMSLAVLFRTDAAREILNLAMKNRFLISSRLVRTADSYVRRREHA